MLASAFKNFLSIALVFGACTGCFLPRRKNAKLSQGPPLSQLLPDRSTADTVVPISSVNAGIDDTYPIQQVAVYSPDGSGAEAVVRRVPDRSSDFIPGLPMGPSTVDVASSASMSAATHVAGLELGHASARQLPPPSLAERVNTEMLAGNYIIETGDSLDIKFRNTTELNEMVTVRPDGMISLPIIGDVQAAGTTPEGLRQVLIARYSIEVRKPDIAVIVRSFAGNNVYIGGEVFSPGRIPLNGRVTTLNAIILAGGFKDTADQKRVIVRRVDGSCCEYDLKSVLECKGGRDIQLQPYDVVYVPKSHIAKVNQFVDQYIEKVLPFSRSFGIFVSHNTGLTSAVGSP